MSIEYCCLPPMLTSLEHNIGNTLFLDLSEKRIFLLKHFDIVLYYMNKVGFDTLATTRMKKLIFVINRFIKYSKIRIFRKFLTHSIPVLCII